jgi:tripartite-type tricarboxylate transporter receptor subunit TctC
MSQIKNLISAVAAVTVATGVAQAQADDIADFYKGKQITLQVGFGAGGGYDTTARIFARHFGKFVPGKPNVVVQNVPGAGSLKLANRIYSLAPKNGTVIGTVSPSTMMVPLYGKRKVKFTPEEFSWIGSVHSDVMACGIWKGAGENIKTLPDFIKAKGPLIFGASGVTSLLGTYPLFLKSAFGANVKIVHGYRGTKGVNLGMQNGELNGTCGMYESSVRGAFASSFNSGDLVLFVQLGLSRNVKLFGDATNVFSMIKDPEVTKIAKLVFGPSEITRPIVGPPGIPKARLAALRKAMADTMKDPGMIADGKRIKTTFHPMSGEEVQARFAEFYKSSPELVEKAYNMTYQAKNPRKKKKK